MRKQEIFIFYQYEENHGSPQLSLLVTEGNICLWIYICAQNENSVSLSRCNDRIFWKIVSHRFLGNSIAYEENGNFSFAFKFDWYLQSKKMFVFIVYNSIVVNTYTLRILAQNLINETTFPIYAFLDTEEKNGIELFFFFNIMWELLYDRLQDNRRLTLCPKTPWSRGQKKNRRNEFRTHPAYVISYKNL